MFEELRYEQEHGTDYFFPTNADGQKLRKARKRIQSRRTYRQDRII